MTASFRLPKRVHNGALLLANVAIVPEPGLRINGLTNAAQYPVERREHQLDSLLWHCVVHLLETAQIMLEHRRLAELHERTYGRGRRIELGDLVLVNYAPVAIVAGIEGRALELQVKHI